MKIQSCLGTKVDARRNVHKLKGLFEKEENGELKTCMSVLWTETQGFFAFCAFEKHIVMSAYDVSLHL